MPAFAETGLYHNSQLVASPADGKALFRAIEKANTTDEEVDVCYKGDFEEAIAETEERVRGAIIFNVIDVYGENQYPDLDVEIYDENGSSAYSIVPACN